MTSTPNHQDSQTPIIERMPGPSSINSPAPPDLTTTIHILRHGESLHNIQKPYPHPDPPLTAAGTAQALALRPAALPDLLLVSPMTRTIQTAALAFGHLLPPNQPLTAHAAVQVWPDLREARREPCNRGVDRAELARRFPALDLDLGECRERWDYPPDAGPEEAAARAEGVRARLAGLGGRYRHVWVVTHRGFAAYLVQGERLAVCGEFAVW
ncbi:histidine phosphatase superfamily [Lasiosphaeris hirsuta]|uniref:Histidine phosphatase superfamily n=1 Tax=Lasiosphaeris hirsuta TaxID=260670 RepID=A0AA40DVB7_9PEZI|nr:histidine phosphatase superfamily [Lasiosphaeris hirsuta]